MHPLSPAFTSYSPVRTNWINSFHSLYMWTHLFYGTNILCNLYNLYVYWKGEKTSRIYIVIYVPYTYHHHIYVHIYKWFLSASIILHKPDRAFHWQCQFVTARFYQKIESIAQRKYKVNDSYILLNAWTRPKTLVQIWQKVNRNGKIIYYTILSCTTKHKVRYNSIYPLHTINISFLLRVLWM